MADERPAEQPRHRFPVLPILLAGAGSALAAVLLARLGLVGTVIGAALTPIIIITVQELAQRPLERVAEVGKVKLDGTTTPALRALRPWERVRWRRVAVLAGVAFALTAAALTAVEAVLDRPVATDRPDGILGTRPAADPPSAPAGTTSPDDDDDEQGATTAETDTAPATTTTETDGATTDGDTDDGGTTGPETDTGSTTGSGTTTTGPEPPPAESAPPATEAPAATTATTATTTTGPAAPTP